MQNYSIPNITAEEAINLSWVSTSTETLKAVRKLYLSILHTPCPIDEDEDGAYRFVIELTALWNAGRVQGIREERARRKSKSNAHE